MSSACYAWYFVTAGTADTPLPATAPVPSTRFNVLPSSIASTGGITLGKLWIRSLSLAAASAAELAGTAWSPSATSRQISRLFQRLGESPNVHLASMGPAAYINSDAYVAAGDYWLVNLTTTQPSSLIFQVEGSQGTVMGCSVQQTVIPLAVADADGSSSSMVAANAPAAAIAVASSAPASLASGVTLTSILQDPCAMNRLVARIAGASTLASAPAALLYTDLGLSAGTASPSFYSAAPASSTLAAAGLGSLSHLAPVAAGGAIGLTTSGALLLPNGTTWTVPNSGGSAVALTSLAVPRSCDWLSGYGTSRASSLVAAWPATGSLLVVVAPDIGSMSPAYAQAGAQLTSPLSSPIPPAMAGNWTSTTPLQVSAVTLPGVAKIHDVDVDHIAQRLVVLARTTAGVDTVLSLDPTALSSSSTSSSLATASVRTESTYPTTGGLTAPLDSGTRSPSLRVTVGRARARDLYLSGDILLYSTDGGASAFPIALTTRNPTLVSAGFSSLTTGEWIMQVATVPAVTAFDNLSQNMPESPNGCPANTFGGGFAVLTSTNRVFVGTAGGATALEVYSGMLTGSVGGYQLNWTPAGELVALSVGGVAPWISVTSIPVASDFSVSQWSVAGLTCPYLSMSASLPSEVYMDVGSNLTVTGELVLSSSSPSQVPALSLGDSTLLTAIPTAPPVKYSLNTILASLSTTIAPNAAAGAGFAAVAASPQSSPLGCASMSPRSVGVVRAACPPSRRLVALGSVSSAATVLVNCTAPPGSSSSTAATQQYTVTADAGTWTDWDSGVVGAVAKSMAYNCSRFGQPQTAFYTYLYQPLLAVYDGPTFVTNVTADFALTEILGRNTFGYNMTASDAGCVLPAPSASDMKGIWSSKSYTPCYTSATTSNSLTAAQLAQAYPIFNATNGNRIHWSSSLNGIYLFRATVLDPTFSYCTLSTDFAVQVYGAPLAAGTQIGIVLGFIFTVLGALGASYFIYRQSKTKEKIE